METFDLKGGARNEHHQTTNEMLREMTKASKTYLTAQNESPPPPLHRFRLLPLLSFDGPSQGTIQPSSNTLAAAAAAAAAAALAACTAFTAASALTAAVASIISVAAGGFARWSVTGRNLVFDMVFFLELFPEFEV